MSVNSEKVITSIDSLLLRTLKLYTYNNKQLKVSFFSFPRLETRLSSLKNIKIELINSSYVYACVRKLIYIIIV